MGRVLRESLTAARVQICAGSVAAVDDLSFSGLEDCSRVFFFLCPLRLLSVSKDCLEFSFQGFVCPVCGWWHSCMIGSPTPSCSEKILLLVLSKRNAGEDVEGFDLVSRSFLASVATCPVGVAVALAISFTNKELGTANGLFWFEMLEGSSL
ncbi:hypothetical protein Bca101_007315 [Brassica carinata]